MTSLTLVVRGMLMDDPAENLTQASLLSDTGRGGRQDRSAWKKKQIHGCEVASAMQKEIRAGREEAAAYWTMLLYEASPTYAWKRICISAAEDVGFGSPDTVALVNSLCAGWFASKGQAYYVSGHTIIMAAMALARAPKDVEVDDLMAVTSARIKAHDRGLAPVEMPDYAVDKHTERGRRSGKTLADWFIDRHHPDVCDVPLTRLTEARVAHEPGLEDPRVAAFVAERRRTHPDEERPEPAE